MMRAKESPLTDYVKSTSYAQIIDKIKNFGNIRNTNVQQFWSR